MDATRLSEIAGGIGLEDPVPEPLRGMAAVLFEMPGVLYEATVWRRWLLRLVSRMGLITNYGTFYETWEHQYQDEVNAGVRTLNDALTEYLQAVGLARPLVDEVVAAAAAQRKRLEDEPRPLPGVSAVLELLSRRNLKLAVTADTDETTAEVRHKLERLGLASRFRAVVSSRDLGVIKPAPQCYLAAVDALGVAPAAIAFVGYRESHLAGARALGLSTVGLSVAPAAWTDRHVSRIEQLADVFAGPPAARRAA